MGETEDTLQPCKKRGAGRELTRENLGLDDDEESSEHETGSFKKASDEVIASRRILKVRRNQTASAPSSNPFGGISLIPPSAPTVAEKVDSEKSKYEVHSENKNERVAEVSVEENNNKHVETSASKPQDNDDVAESDKIVNDDERGASEDKKDSSHDEKDERKNIECGSRDKTEDKKDEKDLQSNEKAKQNFENPPLSSFQQLSSSQNAFTGLTGTGFSGSSFSFDSIPKDGSLLGTSSFSFDSSTNGSSSLFNTAGPSIVSKTEKSSFPAMQEVIVETGEENEKGVFSADSVLFEFLDGGWKERGKGELKLNISATGNGKARLLMRARGNYRLILNASLYPDMKLTNMEKKGITFACLNSTSEEIKDGDGLSTIALKFKDPSFVSGFRAAVMAHKGAGNTAVTLRTPENFPKPTDD